MSRNVEALCQIMDAIVAALDPGVIWVIDSDAVAKALATHGVLAVDSLTDEQVTQFDNSGDYIPFRDGRPLTEAEIADDIRAALRRCALDPSEPPALG